MTTPQRLRPDTYGTSASYGTEYGWSLFYDGPDECPEDSLLDIVALVRKPTDPPTDAEVENAIEAIREPVAEIVRRYNLHDELVKALENWIATIDGGMCPHGNSGRYPASAWFCDDCVQQARDALARVRKEGTE